MSLTTATATALTPELLELAEELELLGGGGDARVGYAQVLCRVRPPSVRSVRVVTAEPEGCVVHVRDPRCPEETPEADAVRRFRISPGGVIGAANDDSLGREHAFAAAEGLFEAAGASALEWLLSGFSSAVIAAGESGSGKTFALFGPAGTVAQPERYSLCSRLLHELFSAIDASRPLEDFEGADAPHAPHALSLALSCWEVRHTEVVDLLVPNKEGPHAAAAAAAGGPHPFVQVEARTLEVATRLLSTARARSVSGATRGAAASGLPSRSSLFVQVSPGAPVPPPRPPRPRAPTPTPTPRAPSAWTGPPPWPWTGAATGCAWRARGSWRRGGGGARSRARCAGGPLRASCTGGW
jgi:hypothetical protein